MGQVLDHLGKFLVPKCWFQYDWLVTKMATWCKGDLERGQAFRFTPPHLLLVNRAFFHVFVGATILGKRHEIMQ